MSDTKIIKYQKKFNIEGPCDPKKHYIIPALLRQTDVKQRIDDERYFVLHAPRQSGKTTFLKAMAKEINDEGQYYALYCSLERLQGNDKIKSAINVVVASLKRALKASKLATFQSQLLEISDPTPEVVIGQALTSLCDNLDKPLVIFFDEADCLSGKPLIAFLRDIRACYMSRDETPFPMSIALIGMRQIRDYIAQVRPEELSLGTASPFNIASPLTLTNFTRDEIGLLYGQHTEATGQIFEPDSIDKAWYWTEGQPWLVNALAKQVVEENLKRDFSITITPIHIDSAAEMLIKRRETHIVSLLARLNEPRVQKVIEPMLNGERYNVDPFSDDVSYCLDLGLVKEDVFGDLHPANPIYASVIIRTLNRKIQSDTPKDIANKWMDGKILDMNGLLNGFQPFWAQYSELLEKDLAYKQSLPQLTLTAFLQRVLNGNGIITPEYSIGRGRVDLCAIYKGKDYLIELKMVYDKSDVASKKQEGLEQLDNYMDKDSANEAWLIIFDRYSDKSWKEKITWETITQENGRTIHVLGC